MSGKLIMKRKRAEQLSADHNPVEGNETKRNCTNNDTHHVDTEKDNLNTNTSDSNALTAPQQTTTTNKILLEALQKIIELQNELDAFEQDLNESELYADAVHNETVEEPTVEAASELEAERLQLDAEVANSFEQENRRCEAEALGFAMCARETLLFLQSEGVPADSLLYKSLLDKLVGQSDGLLHV